MSDIKNRDLILEAIDQLRKRKARPDIHRICNFLTRKFSIDSRDTKSDLQRCVEKEIVYKVEYKGSISYRNASKKSYGTIKKDNMSGEQTIIKTDAKVFASIVITAMADLILGEPDYLEFGVPSAELIKKILTKHSSKYNKKILTELLQKEVENGGLILMENGHYSLGPSSRSDDSNRSENDGEYISVNTSDDNGSPPSKIKKKPGPKPGKRKAEMERLKEGLVSVRQGIRRKRAKKVFDPSDLGQTQTRVGKKRGRPLGSLNKATLERQQARTSSPSGSTDSSPRKPGSRDGGVCSVCHREGRKGIDRMISCRDCINRAHYDCLNQEDGMLRLSPDNTWQCPHCKTCVVCYETMRSDAGNLTVCSICSDAYHALCHKPSIPEKSKGSFQWICNNCEIVPMLSSNIERKIRKTENLQLEKLSQDTMLSSGMADLQLTPTPPNSGRSSPSYQSNSVSPTPPALSPQINLNGRSQSNCSTDYKYSDYFDADDQFDPSIPDASNWTHDDVYNYFLQYFPEEALVFKEQEIDGHSLLLMKRIDVLTSLNLKLGPALKIYRHVVKLQVRKDDRKLYWL